MLKTATSSSSKTICGFFFEFMATEKHIWDKVNHWKEEIEFLKDIIAKTELVETIKWGTPVYTYQNKNIIGLGGFKSYFGVWFMNGVFLKDEAKKLVNAQEGVTKALRQWRFLSLPKTSLSYLSHGLAESVVFSHQTSKFLALTSIAMATSQGFIGFI